MKKTQNILLTSAIVIASAALAWNIIDTKLSTTIYVAPPAPLLTHQQKAWLGALEWCESRGTPKAINPKDLDNTPSYGLLQFKPSTLTEFEKLYSITGDLMNPDTQEAIVTQMIIRGGIDWHHQFPACTRLLGLPPKGTTTVDNSPRVS